jgi:hypothetical protein
MNLIAVYDRGEKTGTIGQLQQLPTYICHASTVLARYPSRSGESLFPGTSTVPIQGF